MPDNLIIETTSGKVAGKRERGVRQWLGIEYAVAERFGLPEAVAAWDGVRDAKEFAPQVPQGMGKRFMFDRPDFCEAGSLALNIWAPEEPGPHPVFFWIHGGAFVAGGSNMYEGDEFAREHGIVVVGINYRLGALGFAAFGEALGIPSIATNIGLRDQIAALEWVRDNIKAFGGDPRRVTIAGESAGSMSVSLLMVSPKARGLFHGAILQSGALNLIQDRATAHRLARRYAELLGLDQGSLEMLKSLPLADLFRAQQQVGEEEKGGLPAAPFWDDDLLPESLAVAEQADHAPVPVIAGSNAEESRLFEWIAKDILPLERSAISAILRAQLPSAADAEAILTCYPDNIKGNRALATDLTFAMSTRHFAEDHAAAGYAAWAYRFDWRQWLFGAAHAMDMLFLFPFRNPMKPLILGGPMWGGRAALARTMKNHWAHFIRQGCPRDDWPPYTPSDRKVMLLNTQSRIATNPDAERVNAWKGRIVAPRIGSHSTN